MVSQWSWSHSQIYALVPKYFSWFLVLDTPYLHLCVWASSSLGLPYLIPTWFNKWWYCIGPVLILMCIVFIKSLISLNTKRSFPVFDNLSRRYHMVLRSGDFLGYPKKFRNHIWSQTLLFICGSERLYHFYKTNILTFGIGIIIEYYTFLCITCKWISLYRSDTLKSMRSDIPARRSPSVLITL